MRNPYLHRHVFPVNWRLLTTDSGNVNPILVNPSFPNRGCSPPTVMIPHSFPRTTPPFLNWGCFFRGQRSAFPQREAPTGEAIHRTATPLPAGTFSRAVSTPINEVSKRHRHMWTPTSREGLGATEVIFRETKPNVTLKDPAKWLRGSENDETN